MRSSITIRRRAAVADGIRCRAAQAGRAVRSPPGRGAAADQRDLHRASHHQLRSDMPREDQRAAAGFDRLVSVRAPVAGGDRDLDCAAPCLTSRDHRARTGSVRCHALDRHGRRDLPARFGGAGRAALPVCRTGCSTRTRCMLMRPAGAPTGPRVVDRDHPAGNVLADRRALQPRAVQRTDRHRVSRDRDLRSLERLQPSGPQPDGKCAGPHPA